MPIDYGKYPENWKTEIRPRILARAENKCEWCGVENSTYRGSTLIVLTIAHLRDADPMNVDDDNLSALCQRCHLNHDRPHHIATRRTNRLRRIRETILATGQQPLWKDSDETG